MSELVNARKSVTNFRWQLLTTVSAIALIGSIYGAGKAKAADDDGDRPTVWIELGGQLSRLDDGQEAFAPAFPASPPRPSIFPSPQKLEGLPLYSIDETGKLSFEPGGSDWVLSASVRYGRSGSDRHSHQQTNPAPFYFSLLGNRYTAKPAVQRFADTGVQNNEYHVIADFQAGKDVGLGMFGSKDGSSVFNAGVRFAQFSNKSNIALKSNPDAKFSYKYINYPSLGITNEKVASGEPYHSNRATLRASRSFRGIGPSISWNASAPIVGDSKDGEFTFDWGLNAAMLFGRQRAKVQHQTTSLYHSKHADRFHPHTVVSHFSTNPPTRTHTVTVPNIGGFAGATWRIENFKVSAGYRADLFFGAMDGGIDARKSENVGFYGPFASVSVGIGG